jgi:hypothetical protein
MTVTSDMTINAQAFKSGYNPSSVASASFTLAAIAPPTTGNIYYVATNGSDSNPGTISQPFRTVGRGIASLASGDTLIIRAGTYNEDINSSQFAGKSGVGFASNPAGTTNWGTIGTPTTIQAYQTESVTINEIHFNDNGSTASYVLFKGDPVAKNFHVAKGVHIGQIQNTQTIDHIKFDGVDFTNTNFAASAIVSLLYCSGFRCENTSGIGNSIVHHIWITNSKIHDTIPLASGTSYGIYQDGASNSVFELTEIYNTSGYGIHQDYGDNNNNIYRYLYIHDIGQGGLASNAPQFAILIHGDPTDEANTGNNNQVYGNLITHSMNGINLINKNNSVYNNTLYRIGNGNVPCDVAGTYCYDAITNSNSTGPNFIKNNIVFGNRINSIADYIGNAVVTNNLTNDPLFVNPAANCTGTDCPGFHLQNGSMAINFGTASIAGSINIPPCGNPPGCYYGSAPDAGSYEYK